MIKPGDKILLKNVPPKEHDRYPVIVHGMVKYLGTEVTVKSVGDPNGENTLFRIKENGGVYSWCLWMVEKGVVME